MFLRTQPLFYASLLGLSIGFASPVLALEAGLSSEAKSILDKRPMLFPPVLQTRKALAGHVQSERDKFEKSYDLFIRYTPGTIYNPTTRSFDAVWLRAYQQKTDTGWDAGKPGQARFHAPTVVMSPGQTVRYKLYNQLPVQVLPDQPASQLPSIVCPKPATVNTPPSPGCFNVTNLHSHGLWVSPSGNSDNVLLSIEPSVNFEYEYNVPVDHPAGTFWYHPHIHGTTAVQVASGMAGALVIEGAREPSPNPAENGDLDTLLTSFKPSPGEAGTAQEVIMMQQISYACLGVDGAVDWSCAKKADDTINGLAACVNQQNRVDWACAKSKGPGVMGWLSACVTSNGSIDRACVRNGVGVVENFAQVGPGSAWSNSGRYTTINGQVQPKIPMLNNRVYRWRLIDAGFQSTIVFGIKKANDAALEKYLKGEAVDLKDVCNGFNVTQFEAASDGLTHEKVITKTLNYLQSGYRSDVLFSLPQSGRYCVYDNFGTNNLGTNLKQTQLLAIIDAANNPVAGPKSGLTQDEQQRFLVNQLAAAAKYQSPVVQAEVLAGINNKDGIKLTRFVPHPVITDKEITDSNQTEVPIKFGGPSGFPINDQVYDPNVMSHTLILGETQKWKLWSVSGSHPYHIHVNPFQIKSIIPRTCNAGEVPGPSTFCKPAGSTLPDNDFVEPQYKNLVGTWKDTLLVTQNDVTINIATRYQRYIGKFVLHCHILGHEDQGMMQNVEVVLPDSNGKPSGGAHAGH